MLQFLQTGKALYVLAGICVLGIISKLVTSSLYKRLIKETGNMALTKNFNLRGFRQRTENLFMLNHGIRNTSAYIDKQIYGFRYMRMSLDVWDNLSVQAMILCFLLGGLAAFGAYWYRCDSYYMVLYGTMGVLAGLVLVLVDNGANIAAKRQQLTDCLVDYVENSAYFHKSSEKIGTHAELREIRMESEMEVPETAGGENRTAARGDARTENGGNIRRMNRPAAQAASEKRPLLSKRKGGRDIGNTKEPEADDVTRSIDYLKQGLAQIAASREQAHRELRAGVPEHTTTDVATETPPETEHGKRQLKPEEIRLLGDILQDYLT